MDWSRRRVEILDLQQARVGDPLGRLILLVLDSLIGQWPYIERTVDEVMEACEMKRTAFYQRLNHLKRLGLVSVEDLEGAQRKRWRIGRSNLPDYARHQGRAEVVTTDDRPVRQADVVRHTNAAVRHADESVRNTDEPVRVADGTSYLRNNFPPPSTTFGEWGAAAAAMNAAGVVWAVDAIDAARSRGCSPAHVLAIVEYFREQAPARAWRPGALQRRVATAVPGIPPAEGSWPADGRAARKSEPTAQDLERRHGAELDALPEFDREQLARRTCAGKPGLWFQWQQLGAQASGVRAAMLQALHVSGNAGVPAP